MADPALPDDGEALSPAAAVFADYLADVDDGTEVDFDALCAAHPELAAELRVLHGRWQALRGAFGDLHAPAAPPAPDEDADGIRLESDDASRSRLLRDLARDDAARPRYAIAGEFARGGTAAILRARDKCLRRTLAMKVLLAEHEPGASGGTPLAEPRALARFLEEAQITGQLDHPGIPSVHELGIDSQGRVYFTMPLIKGRNLSEVYALVRGQREGWTLPRAIAVLQRVCDTVAYAHSRGVVHRDLKPSNVMVGRFGETYVMDWGLARVRGREERLRPRADEVPASSIRSLRAEMDTPDSPLVTLDGHVVGTPAYMAPEQARGELDRVGPPSDVYAIGAMLYELLAGQMPFVPPGARPSARTVLARVLEGPPTPLRTTAHDAPDELVAVCEKAMARDPGDRYPGVSELGDDLRAWLEGRVVQAHATGTWAELRKWIGRNRALAAACVSLVLALVIGLVITVVLGGRASASAARLAAELRVNNIERGRLSTAAGNLAQAEGLLWPEHLRTPDSLETRWVLWDLHARHPCLATANADGDLRMGILVDGDRTLVVGDAKGRLHVFEPKTLERRGVVELPEPTAVTALAADAGGGHLFSAHADGALHVITFPGRELARTLRAGDARITALAHARSAGLLLAGCADGGLLLYDTATWTMRRPAPAVRSYVRRVAWNRDASMFATLSNDWTVRVYATADGRIVASFRAADLVDSLLITPAGKVLFGGNERVLFALDPATGKVERSLIKPDAFASLAVTEDGGTLVTCGWQRIDVWSLPDMQRLRTLELPGQGTMCADARGELAITVHPHEVRTWDLADRGRRDLGGHEGRVCSRLTRDGKLFVTGDGAGVLRLFDAEHPGEPVVLGRHTRRVRCLAFSPDGSRLLSGALDRTLQLWSIPERRVLHTFEGHEDASEQTACFSPDGRWIAAGVREGNEYRVALREVNDPERETRIGRFSGQVIAVCFSPDGTRLACSSRGTGLVLLDLAGNRLVEMPTLDQSWTLAFRGDGKKLATGTWGRRIEIFDCATGVRETTLEGHAGTVWGLEWLDDPRLLYSAAADGRVRLWDVVTRQPLLILQPFADGHDALCVHASPDGQRLAVSGDFPTVFLWEVGYYERHIAGNVAAQIERLPATPPGVERVRAWAQDILRRPWPR